MSRFDKALERARASPAGRVRQLDGVLVPDGTPAVETFEAPWQLSEAPAVQALERPPRVEPDAESPKPMRVHPRFAERVVSDTAASAVLVEQFRHLAGYLQGWQAARGGRIVMVASAAAREGRTLTTLNLALALSSSFQRRVLLMDCDLHSPMLHEALGVARHPGVTDALAGRERPSAVAASARLAVLPAGRPRNDAAGVVTSEDMAALLQQVREDYDWVVIDTPPATIRPEASLLGPLVDGVLFVVGAGRTKADVARRAIGRVGGDRIIGVVLNGVAAGDMTATERRRFQSQR